ncbi:MAG: hypothetical protein M3365_08025 [Gemmatimonadota bacterium]|nr:hypothetical protein [Gemmatimonadota bacterium]
MLRFISAISLILTATAAAAAGQSTATNPGPISYSLGVGPTRAFRGVDAPGVQGQGGISYNFGAAFGLRLEGAGQWYETQPLYPCIVQDAGRCYQTIRRALAAGTLSATYNISRVSDDKWRTVPYLISGIGIYRSRRIATHYPDCQPASFCDVNTYRLELRDTQFGLSGGAGVESRLGRVGVFAESRVHYIYNDRPNAEPSNDYFVWPFSIGFRF